MDSRIFGWILGFRAGFWDSGPDSEAGLWDFGLDPRISGWILRFWAGFQDLGLDSGISGWTLGLDWGFGLD